jgi:hypothetical protein
MPTIIDSRQGPGILTLGSTDFGTQISNVKLTANNDSTDGTPTLGVPKPAPIVTTTWALEGSAIQDWESDAGFVNYCALNNNTIVDFEWVPNNDVSVKYTGRCLVVAVDIGGDIATQLSSDWSFGLEGEPVRGTTVRTATATAK